MNEENQIPHLLHKLNTQQDELTVQELQDLHALFNSKGDMAGVEFWMLQHWESLSNQKEEKFEGLVGRVEKELHRKRIVNRSLVRIFQRYAAILLLPLLGGLAYFMLKTVQLSNAGPGMPLVAAEQQYISPMGMRSKVLLKDSTVVWLNADSYLTVYEGFANRERRVALTGEAYFEVKKNEQIPFVVMTSEVDIKVLGTSFNVSSYPDSQTFEAVLVEGRIEAVTKHKEQASQRIQMEPSQLLTLKKNGKALELQEHVNTDPYTSWTSGKLTFQLTSMDQVIKTLERWYNVCITLQDPALRLYTYSGTFDNRSIEQILRYLELSSPIRYAINKENITIYVKE